MLLCNQHRRQLLVCGYMPRLWQSPEPVVKTWLSTKRCRCFSGRGWDLDQSPSRHRSPEGSKVSMDSHIPLEALPSISQVFHCNAGRSCPAEVDENAETLMAPTAYLVLNLCCIPESLKSVPPDLTKLRVACRWAASFLEAEQWWGVSTLPKQQDKNAFVQRSCLHSRYIMEVVPAMYSLQQPRSPDAARLTPRWSQVLHTPRTHLAAPPFHPGIQILEANHHERGCTHFQTCLWQCWPRKAVVCRSGAAWWR